MNFYPTEMADFFAEIEKLKNVKRFKGNPQMKEKESSADHSWKLALMIMVVAPIMPNKIDVERTLKMALVHNLFEIYSDNTDYVLLASGKISETDKKKAEEGAINRIRDLKPSAISHEIYGIIVEFTAGETEEAKFVRALSKIETFDHLLNYGPEGYDTPELIYNYADDAVVQFPELKLILDELKERFKKKCQESGIKI